MRFIKMHGIGNDYVYVNGFAHPVADPAEVARKISDRHFGVGGDGLILVAPADEEGRRGGAIVRMRMFNADGSEAEMCGNGVRCVCKFAYDHNVAPGVREQNPLLVQTGRGVLRLAYELDSAGKVSLVTVDMGEPILAPAEIPVRLPDLSRVVNHPMHGLFTWPAGYGEWGHGAGLDPRMTCISMGNPHAVFFVQDVQAVPLEAVGPIIEKHNLFPRRINVHVVQVARGSEMIMRTWERGSGITLACGTGAAAVCVAGVLTGRSERKVLIHLPGGDLTLEWRASDGHVHMTGPATEVFQGDWPEG